MFNFWFENHTHLKCLTRTATLPSVTPVPLRTPSVVGPSCPRIWDPASVIREHLPSPAASSISQPCLLAVFQGIFKMSSPLVAVLVF